MNYKVTHPHCTDDLHRLTNMNRGHEYIDSTLVVELDDWG